MQRIEESAKFIEGVNSILLKIKELPWNALILYENHSIVSLKSCVSMGRLIYKVLTGHQITKNVHLFIVLF